MGVSGGRADVRLILRSLLEQLSRFAQRPVSFDRPLPELSKQFEELLASAASRLGDVVIVLDGLDEFSDDVPDRLPFLPTDTLPLRVFFVVTSRPGPRLERLRLTLARTPVHTLQLRPLNHDELTMLLQKHQPTATDQQVRQLYAASGGNALHARTIVDALTPEAQMRSTMNLYTYFAGQLGDARRSPELIDVLGVLAAAHRPLGVSDLSAITGHTQRSIDQGIIGPLRQFLQNIDEHFAFYHERFREFVIERYVYPDELRTYHARIARWLIGCDSRYADDRWKSLARHVYESGDYDTFSRVIDGTFLTGKLRRFGYAVLEDIDLLARVLLDGMEPMAIERCMNVLDL